MNEYKEMNEYYEALRSDREALIKCLEERCISATKFLSMVGSDVSSSQEKKLADKILLLRLTIAELRNGAKEPAEVIDYFEELTKRESEEFKNTLKKAIAKNTKDQHKQLFKLILNISLAEAA